MITASPLSTPPPTISNPSAGLPGASCAHPHHVGNPGSPKCINPPANLRPSFPSPHPTIFLAKQSKPTYPQLQTTASQHLRTENRASKTKSWVTLLAPSAAPPSLAAPRPAVPAVLYVPLSQNGDLSRPSDADSRFRLPSMIHLRFLDCHRSANNECGSIDLPQLNSSATRQRYDVDEEMKRRRRDEA